jgi:uncharacterized protein
MLMTMNAQAAIDFIIHRQEKELQADLYYHGPHHVHDVMNAIRPIAIEEKISDEEFELLRVAAAFHDCGFLETYANHEAKGCEIARNILPGFGFGNEQIHQIEQMIMATVVPQAPATKLERILCDADLDYLGREDVVPIAKTLFNELNARGIVKDESTWNRIQVRFLREHHYHTAFSKLNRQSGKIAYLAEIERIVEGYGD